MIERLTAEHILRYWEELKESYTKQELNDKLKELTITRGDDNTSYSIAMMDFKDDSTVGEPDIQKV